MKMNKTITVIGILLTLNSCTVTQNYTNPVTQTAANYRDIENTDSISIAEKPWNQYFTDTILIGLIDTALKNNYDLKTAVARIKYAEANFKQSERAFFPNVSADAGYTLSKSSDSSSPANQYALNASVSWEADIWGKLNNTKKANLSALLASEAYKRSIQTEIVASVANNYYALMAYDEQLQIAEQTLEIRKSDTVTMKELKTYAVVTGADVEQSIANMYSAEIEAEGIRKSIRETENTLSILLGQMPDNIPRGNLKEQIISDDLRTGVPIQLLSNRPDIQEAELNFRNAFELTNVARTYFYPSLNISGTGGFATVNTLKGFFDGSFYGNLLGGLTQPIFDQGLNKQRLAQAQATQEEALYSFQSLLLTASQEVDDALFSYQNAANLYESRKKQIASLEKAVDYTKELLKYTSNVNYTDVLTAETNLLSAQLGRVSDKLQQLQATVNLYRALGGGWK